MIKKKVVHSEHINLFQFRTFSELKRKSKIKLYIIYRLEPARYKTDIDQNYRYTYMKDSKKGREIKIKKKRNNTETHTHSKRCQQTVII